MPDIFPSHSDWTWDTIVDWYDDDGEVTPAGHVPQAADHVKNTINSGNGDLDVVAATNALGALTMTGFIRALELNDKTINVDGNAILDGLIMSPGGGEIQVEGDLTLTLGMNNLPAEVKILLNSGGILKSITANGVTGGEWEINAGEGHRAFDSHTMDKWKLVAGDYIDNGFDHFVAGDILDTGGTLTSTGTWEQTASGDVEGGTFSHLKLGSAGVVSNLSGTLRANEYTIGPGDSGVAVTGAQSFYCYAYGHDRWHQTSASGSIVVDILSIYTNDDYNIGYLNLTGMAGLVRIIGNKAAATASLILTDRWQLDNNDCLFFSFSNDRHAKLACGAFGIDITGAITLGSADGDRSGLIDFGTGRSSIASVADAGAASTLNAIDFGSAYLQCSAALNLDNIAPSCDDGFSHIEGLGTGSLVNCIADPGGTVWCHNISDPGANAHTSYKIDEHAPPGSGMLMGCGI